jgi:hypothetical protein
MAKQATIVEIERWRRNYGRLRKIYSNKEIAKTLRINDANLSALGKGNVNKNGKRKNPGADFIKRFYMSYPEIPDLPDDDTADSNANEGRQNYKKEEQPDSAEEGKVPYMNWDDPGMMRNELFSLQKKNDEYFRTEFSKITNSNQTAVDAVKTMAESNLILSQEIAFYRKKANPS